MSFMDKFAAGLEKLLMPVANFVSRQKHLQAITHGFIAALPIVMAGSFTVLFNNVLCKSDSLFGRELVKIAAYNNTVQPIMDKYVVPFMGNVWFGTLAITSLFYLITMSYKLAQSYEVDGLSAALVAIASYFSILPQNGTCNIPVDAVDTTKAAAGLEALQGALDAGVTSFTQWGLLPITGDFGAATIFSVMLVAFLSTEIFRVLTQKNFTLKLPEQVPPAVSKAFASILPGMVAITVVAIIGMIWASPEGPFGQPLHLWINSTIQKPLMDLGQSPLMYIGLILLSQLFWLIGIHGMNIVGPVLDSVYLPALRENLEKFALTNSQADVPNVLVRNTVDIYAMHGGSGATLALILAVFIFSKREEYRELSKLSFGCGLFQINEPVVFGLPIVLNPILAIPFIIIPPLCTFIAWFATNSGFAAKIVLEQPWVTPPIFSAYLGTAGDWKATIVAVATFVIAIAIYIPFVIVANKTANSDASSSIDA